MKLYVSDVHFAAGMLHLGRDIKKRLIKVMRMKAGDSLEVLASGRRWECRIAAIHPDGVELVEVQELEPPPAPRLMLVLGQAIPKGDRFEWLIEKGTELGIAEIHPLITQRTIARPVDSPVKLQRWNEIAEHAAGQSESAMPARVFPPQSLKNFISRIEGARLYLHERGNAPPLRQILKNLPGGEDALLQHRITFVVGPEGGWTPEESAELENAGYVRIHLGKRILRAETAGLVLAAILQYDSGDFSD